MSDSEDLAREMRIRWVIVETSRFESNTQTRSFYQAFDFDRESEIPNCYCEEDEKIFLELVNLTNLQRRLKERRFPPSLTGMPRDR